MKEFNEDKGLILLSFFMLCISLMSIFTVSVQAEEVCSTTSFHSADYTEDWEIDLSELLRVIEIYNSDTGYHCDLNEKDGYGLGNGDRNCQPHDLDYNSQNWKISLSELLRIIQIYNVNKGYHCDPNGEDGFSLGKNVDLEREAIIELGKLGNMWADINLVTVDVCELDEIVCNSDGKITGVFLGSEGLTGSIPKELGNLENLRVLDLSHNQLTG